VINRNNRPPTGDSAESLNSLFDSAMRHLIMSHHWQKTRRKFTLRMQDNVILESLYNYTQAT
jgi:hypothetical protein